MMSVSHEALLLLFQKRPELAPELLRDALGVELAFYAEARFEACDLSYEERADLVLLLVDGKPTLAIVIEISIEKDECGRRSWPAYVTGVRKRFGCPALLLVLAWSDAVADWARAPVRIRNGSTLIAHVVGPKDVPMVRELELARRNPELSVLSAIAHVKSKVGLDVALAALNASQALRDERSRLYLHLISLCLDTIARIAFEERRPDRRQAARELLMRLARIRGREEGLREGKAGVIPELLDARGINLASDLRERVLACRDLDTLDRWIQKAAIVATADELFID